MSTLSWLAAHDAVQAATPKSSTMWDGSPYAWMLTLSTHARGTAGEHLIAEWLTREGQRVEPRETRQHDMIINGRKAEVKTSMLSAERKFNWLQVRTDRDYQDLVLLGLLPSGEPRVYYLPEAVGRLNSNQMHAPESRCIRVTADRIPDWLSAWGGSLTEALSIIEGVK